MVSGGAAAVGPLGGARAVLWALASVLGVFPVLDGVDAVLESAEGAGVQEGQLLLRGASCLGGVLSRAGAEVGEVHADGGLFAHVGAEEGLGDWGDGSAGSRLRGRFRPAGPLASAPFRLVACVGSICLAFGGPPGETVHEVSLHSVDALRQEVLLVAVGVGLQGPRGVHVRSPAPQGS